MSVRLIRTAKRLEAAMAAAMEKEPELPQVLLCWHGRSLEVDGSVLEPGRYIAVDCQIAYWEDRPAMPPPRSPAAPCAASLGADLFRQVVECERVTEDDEDLGWVTNAEGRRIGRVVAIEGLDGEIVTWDLDDDWRQWVPVLPRLADRTIPAEVGTE